jgi:hypothetical protein
LILAFLLQIEELETLAKLVGRLKKTKSSFPLKSPLGEAESVTMTSDKS